MGTQTFKEFVHQLFSDAAFREKFVSTPHDVLARSNLGVEESAALLRLRQRLATPNGTAEVVLGEPWP